MQELTRIDPTGVVRDPRAGSGDDRGGKQLELMRAPSPDEQSVGELVSRLAHESRDLAAIELRRLRVEMGEQTRRAARAAAAGYIAIDFIALATLALAVGVFLVLASWWNSYAAAAFATSGLLAIVALGAGLAVRGLMRRMRELTNPAHHDER
jgi:uncharacterized membrane protein YqjE